MTPDEEPEGGAGGTSEAERADNTKDKFEKLERIGTMFTTGAMMLGIILGLALMLTGSVIMNAATVSTTEVANITIRLFILDLRMPILLRSLVPNALRMNGARRPIRSAC